MQKPRQFLLAVATDAATCANNHGPQPPDLSGDDNEDLRRVEVWLCKVALLANGCEGAHNGSTYAARLAAAQRIMTRVEQFAT